METFKPVVGITMGDPAGVGPEILLKAMADPALYQRCRPVAVGDVNALVQALVVTGLPLRLHRVRRVEECHFAWPEVDFFDLGLLPEDFARCTESAVCGDAAFTAVRRVIELAMAGEVDATVTAPLNKKAMQMAGHHFAGHTEIYAHYTGAEHYTMLLAHGKLRVVHVSTHVSLREACERVKQARVLEVIRLARDACQSIGIAAPRVAVAGLNPHAGEGGLFGREEIEEILPAIRQAQAEGIDAIGPIPPDSVFSRALGGGYDIVVAMYHDQGHIPIKTAGFRFDGESADIGGVNITYGLPIIRVSVDHGTAFDIAWQNRADPKSLVESIDYAIRMAAHHRQGGHPGTV